MLRSFGASELVHGWDSIKDLLGFVKACNLSYNNRDQFLVSFLW